MSLRSLLLFALLLASLAAAQSDVFISYWFNMTPTRLCAADVPSRCYFIPRIDVNIDPAKTLAVVVYKCSSATGICSVTNPVGDYSLLRYVLTSSPSWYIVSIPRPGLLYAQSSFRIGPAGSNMRVTATQYTACGKTYQYAYYASPGSYNVTPLPLPLYLVDLERCVEYRIVAHTGAVVNITAGWFSLYLAELMPPASKIYTSGGNIVLNGTQHAYFTQFHHRTAPSGAGFYIAGTAAPTLAMHYQISGAWYGPRHYSALGNSTISSSFAPMYGFYGIGEAPSDGVFAVYPTSISNGPFEAAYVANSTAGYFRLYPKTLSGGIVVYAKRFDVVELTLRDAVGILYNTRGVACPAYRSIASTISAWAPSRLDRVAEVEVCNNRTSAVYVALYYTSDAVAVSFFYADKIEPGKCARLRWDTALSSKPALYVYATARNVCARTHIFSTTNYSPGWRHFLFPNNTLKPVAPISPDYDYASLWHQLLNLLSQQYGGLQIAFSQWYASQQNATYTNLTDFLRTQPRFVGTIRMDSATSTWLRTTLNELQRWQTAGAPPSFGTVALPPIPTAVAPATAAAVAIAWAASRRDDDVAASAAVAGVALALFGILMTLVYGTESLALVALGVIVAAAAAAWRRIS